VYLKRGGRETNSLGTQSQAACIHFDTKLYELRGVPALVRTLN
jgi:hypothetical protein